MSAVNAALFTTYSVMPLSMLMTRLPARSRSNMAGARAASEANAVLFGLNVC